MLNLKINSMDGTPVYQLLLGSEILPNQNVNVTTTILPIGQSSGRIQHIVVDRKEFYKIRMPAEESDVFLPGQQVVSFDKLLEYQFMTINVLTELANSE